MKRTLLLTVCLCVGGWLASYSLPAMAVNNHAHDHAAHDEEKHSDRSYKHEGHAEGEAIISEDAAENAGITIASVAARPMSEHLKLTGHIIQNRDTTISVPARLTSVVKDVNVTWGEQVKKGQKLALLESRNNLNLYEITAPMDGIILQRNVSRGDLTENEPLFVIADLSDVWAELHVFPRDLGRVEQGQQVHVRALESDREATAEISIVLPTAEAVSQTVIAIVVLPNAKGEWRPGMTVEGDVHLDMPRTNALAVTEAAIQRMGEQNVVFIQDGNTYHTRPVVLGRRDDGYVEVLEGLKEGEHYVAEGSFIIKADIGKSEAGHDHAH